MTSCSFWACFSLSSSNWWLWIIFSSSHPESKMNFDRKWSFWVRTEKFVRVLCIELFCVLTDDEENISSIGKSNNECRVILIRGQVYACELLCMFSFLKTSFPEFSIHIFSMTNILDIRLRFWKTICMRISKIGLYSPRDYGDQCLAFEIVTFC